LVVDLEEQAPMLSDLAQEAAAVVAEAALVLLFL
jgi:hypothetical protein